MVALAAELKIYLLAGSILEQIPGGPKAYNTSLLFDASGTLLASYRKIHVFEVDLAKGVSLRESDTRAQVDMVAFGRSDLCVMGLSVCYDLCFPELSRELAKHRS